MSEIINCHNFWCNHHHITLLADDFVVIVIVFSWYKTFFEASCVSVKTEPTSSGSQMASVLKPKCCLRPIRSKPLVKCEVLLKEELVSYVYFLSRSHQTGIQGAHAHGKKFNSIALELMGQELLYELMMPMNKPISPSFHAAKAARLILSPLWAPIVGSHCDYLSSQPCSISVDGEHWSCCFTYTHRWIPYSKTTSLYRH